MRCWDPSKGGQGARQAARGTRPQHTHARARTRHARTHLGCLVEDALQVLHVRADLVHAPRHALVVGGVRLCGLPCVLIHLRLAQEVHKVQWLLNLCAPGGMGGGAWHRLVCRVAWLAACSSTWAAALCSAGLNNVTCCVRAHAQTHTHTHTDIHAHSHTHENTHAQAGPSHLADEVGREGLTHEAEERRVQPRLVLVAHQLVGKHAPVDIQVWACKLSGGCMVWWG